jgi:hypothetical protein
MKRGFIIIATGTPTYGNLALNCALSLKANGNWPVILLHTPSAIKGIESRVERIFDYRVSTTSNMSPMEFASLLKLQAYDIAMNAFDKCILLDADSMILPGKDLNSWFDQKQDFVAYYHAAFDYEKGKADRDKVQFWCDPIKIAEAVGNKSPDKMPAINASWIYFKRSDTACGIFQRAMIYFGHKDMVTLFRGFVNEEFCFNAALMYYNYPLLQVPYRPLYLQVFSEQTSDTYITHRFKAFSMAGDIQHAPNIVSMYNTLSDYYREQYGITQKFHFDAGKKATLADKYYDLTPITEDERCSLYAKKILVVVMVYDREENIKLWVNAWCKSDNLNAHLLVVHNTDVDHHSIPTKAFGPNISYFRRENKGFDIGAMKEVFSGSRAFPTDYDIIIWCTDDCLPMRKDFVEHYACKVLDPQVGISCMHISNEVRPHIRTTGFAIRREVAQKLVFPEQIITKDDCYEFEHGEHNNLLQQIERMVLRAVIPSKLQESHLCDINYPATRHRIDEHYDVFKPNEDKLVTFICPVYNSFPEIVSSLLCQTHQNWQLLLIHDGPNDTKLFAFISHVNDPRIRFIETDERKEQWGHPLRQWTLDAIDKGIFKADFVVITNADNYHAPTYIDTMLRGFKDDTIAVYCDKFVTNYKSHQIKPDGTDVVHSYGTIDTKLELGYVDCAGVMVRRDAACKVGWNDMSHSSDWTYFESLINEYGKNRFVKVNGTLLVHN